LVTLQEIIIQKKKEASDHKPKAPIPDTRLEFGLLSIDDSLTPQSGAKSQGVSAGAKVDTNNEDAKKGDKESLDLPFLVPIGEALSEGGGASYLEPSRRETEELALKEKEAGNRAFAENNYQLALVHYSRAIRLDWKYCCT